MVTVLGLLLCYLVLSVKVTHNPLKLCPQEGHRGLRPAGTELCEVRMYVGPAMPLTVKYVLLRNLLLIIIRNKQNFALCPLKVCWDKLAKMKQEERHANLLARKGEGIALEKSQ